MGTVSSPLGDGGGEVLEGLRWWVPTTGAAVTAQGTVVSDGQLAGSSS
jgi:hypothetical protein